MAARIMRILCGFVLVPQVSVLDYVLIISRPNSAFTAQMRAEVGIELPEAHRTGFLVAINERTAGETHRGRCRASGALVLV